MDEMVILESASRRHQLCTSHNTTVLDRVGQLIMLEGTEFTTIKHVADFYSVPLQAIKSLVFDHKDELSRDGYKVLSKKELEKFLKGTFEIPNRGLAIFPRRAILRVGMLLRDSVVAKLVRSYLLNMEEQAVIPPNNQKLLRQMVYQLDQQALQLIKNANQLSSHSDALKDHAQQLRSQTLMVKTIVDEIYINRNHIKRVDAEVQSNKAKIADLQKLTQGDFLDAKKEYISAEQIETLKAKVKQKGKAVRVWAKLKTHFGITRYIFLPKDQFKNALNWLDDYQN